MCFDCVVFDFNGTLFWDTPLHNRAWDLFLEDHHITISDEQKNRVLHGKHNQEILKMLFNHDLTTGEADYFINEKENIYQELVRETGLKLAPGVEDFLDFLYGNRTRFTIATASGIENVNFYFEYLDLARWFDLSKVVFNNGKIKSKPDPEIFIAAMNMLEADPLRTVIFEDSDTGIRAALAALPGKVIRVNSTGSDDCPAGMETISHFGQVPREIFCRNIDGFETVRNRE
ncbi:MAG TPA: HAD family phosphatase [Bacteroidales bacterium]|nr:HAD family phosphatase [Bacteroidales bacterium]